MNICEGCIKQDVCKFRAGVEKEMEGRGIAEPLEVAITCKYKVITPINEIWYPVLPTWPTYPPYTPIWPNYYPLYPTYTPTCTDCNTTTTCGKEW